MDLPERDRLAIWREVYGRFIFNVDIEPVGDRAFEAEVALRRLPGVGVSSGWRTPADYKFGPRQLAMASDNVVLGIVLKGRARVTQLGRDLAIDQGGAAMMTTSDPGYHTMYDGGGHLAVQFPRSALSAVLPDIESRLMRPFPPDSDALKLVIAYAKAALDLDSGRAPRTPAPGRHASARLGGLSRRPTRPRRRSAGREKCHGGAPVDH